MSDLIRGRLLLLSSLVVVVVVVVVVIVVVPLVSLLLLLVLLLPRLTTDGKVQVRQPALPWVPPVARRLVRGEPLV